MSTVILRTTARVLVPLMAVASVHLLLRGHNAPGGGFIAGLVAGAAIVLQRSTSSTPRQRWLRGPALVTWGLAVVLAAAVAGFAFGGSLLASTTWTVDLVAVDAKLASSLFFDAGVYAVVLGVVTTLVEALGEDAW